MGAIATVGPVISTPEEFSNTLGTAASIQSAVQHGNTPYAIRINGLTIGARHGYGVRLAPSAPGEKFVRFYLRVATFPGGPSGIACLYDSVAGFSQLCRLSSSGNLEFGAGAVTYALNTGQWYCIEIHFIGAGANASTIEGRVDGRTIYSTSTATIGGAHCILVVGGNTNQESNTVGDWYIADIAANDTSSAGAAAAESSWVGEGFAALLTLNAAGDNNTWEVGVGAGDYTDLDEYPSDDATTYQKRTTAVVKVFDGNVSDPSAAGIGSTDVIKCVHVHIRGGAISATNNAGRRVWTRIKGKSGGTTHKAQGPGIVPVVTPSAPAPVLLNTTTWVTNTTDGSLLSQLTSYQNPTTGAAWIRTDVGNGGLDTMQIGVENESSTTTEVRVSSLWAIVRYVGQLSRTEADTLAGTDAESAATTQTETESSTATDAESSATAQTQAETLAGTDAETLAAATTEAETATTTDAESLAATTTEDESLSATDAQSITAGISEDDLSLLDEGQAMLVFITDDDSMVMVDAESWVMTGGGGGDTGWLVGAVWL